MYCGAKLFPHETNQFCCLNGKVSLPNLPVPPELMLLYNVQSELGFHFRHNIRAYNHVFSFTSIGVRIDHNTANLRKGVYTYRAQGTMYHKIGSLIPEPSDRPRFLQMYIYDTEHELENRIKEQQFAAKNDKGKDQDQESTSIEEPLNREVLAILKGMLDRYNPYVRVICQIAQGNELHNVRLHIKEQPTYHRQYNMPTSPQVPAILVGGEEPSEVLPRDIIVETNSGQLLNVPDMTCFYDPLQYPLLLHYGSFGWDLTIFSNNTRRISCRAYYAYMLQIRENDDSILLCARKLLQQYVVDNYVKISTMKLKWVRDNQRTFRDDWYSGALDAADANTDYPFIFQISLNFGGYLQVILDSGLFCLQDMHQRNEVYHILIILDERDKLRSPDYDTVVRAEIPDPNVEPELYEAVLKHMIHMPCSLSTDSVCKKNEKCKKKFPKNFAPATLEGEDSYPVYRRRDDGREVTLHNGKVVNNSWVVPYNPWLLMKYDCHINVDICSSVKSVKYLYKYVWKGLDCVCMEVSSEKGVEDEIKQYVDARWICLQDALWRIYKYHMNKISPPIVSLQIHLKDQQKILLSEGRTVRDVLQREKASRTKLTEYFKKNAEDEFARTLLYKEFPDHYGPNFFEDLLKVGSVTFSTYREVVQHLSLIESDIAMRDTLLEATQVQML
ncbi:uncharacterized protein LOC113315708 [Papaver somniferum]|uniref:uncharacterized protein LOC113315708 n=1 Tax=Papaver somniferum TaxID=3469 RepID=UPI000E6FB845|nr:uncharacterized protein LOC113315708 [Papaver somniferum]